MVFDTIGNRLASESLNERDTMTNSDISDLHAFRDDPDEWSDDPEPVKVRPAPSEVVSFRLPSDELDWLQSTAAERGESLSEFIRECLRIRQGTWHPAEIADMTFGEVKMIAYHHGAKPVTQSQLSHVPDFPPTTQNQTSSRGTTSVKNHQLPLQA